MTSSNREIISKKFSTLKVLSILIIVSGHFLKDAFFWVPATFGLLIFAHSSAYFTTLKYNGSFSLQTYWFQKLCRLGINLLVINVFLGCLFVLEKKHGLWTWQTIVNIFGMSGFLNWFDIPNPSPFGNGVWFLTLLLLFYFIYPLLNKFLKRKELIILIFIASLFILNWLNKKFFVGHALWYTICAFLYGFVTAKVNPRLSKRVAVLITLTLFSFLVFLNFFLTIKIFNFILLISVFCFFVMWIEYLHMPESINYFGNFLSKYIFEIYLIHTYLALKLTKIKSIDFLLSLILIVFVSMFLARISHVLKKHLFNQKIQTA